VSGMHVGLVAPSCSSVDGCASETREVVEVLAGGLRASGHRVSLFPAAAATSGSASRDPAHETVQVLTAYDAMPDVDVVHDHTTIGPFLAALRRPELPLVSTSHEVFDSGFRRLFTAVARTASVVCVSQDQRRRALGVPISAVIPPGIDVDAFPVGAGGGGYLVFGGRMSRVGGAHRAVRIARGAGVPLVVLSRLRGPRERAYYREVVVPLLGSDVRVRAVADPAELRELLGGARALVHPVQWPEPFARIVLESQACGTPVITYPVGASTEVVQHGVTGFHVHDVPEAVATVERVQELDRSACRELVSRRFGTTAMVRAHLQLYARLLEGETTNWRSPAPRPAS